MRDHPVVRRSGQKCMTFSQKMLDNHTSIKTVVMQSHANALNESPHPKQLGTTKPQMLGVNARDFHVPIKYRSTITKHQTSNNFKQTHTKHAEHRCIVSRELRSVQAAHTFCNINVPNSYAHPHDTYICLPISNGYEDVITLSIKVIRKVHLGPLVHSDAVVCLLCRRRQLLHAQSI